MGTTLLEALDFSWNHAQDWMYQAQYQKLSIGAKAGKIISDCVVYLFASLLRVNTTEKIANRRISIKAANEYTDYVSSKSYANLRNQSVILVLNGELDIPTSPENFRRLETQSGCKIKFIKVQRFEDIKFEIESLKQCNNKIEALWIRAHGTPFSISFNQFEQINVDKTDYRIEDTRRFLQEQLEKLEQKAPIILESCFTGQKVEVGKENVAQFIASTAGGRKVYAPSREALPIGENITYVPEKGFKVVIKSFQSSTFFAKGSCLSRICAIWHAYRDHVEEITCEFKRN
jgi:hypothetical protein